MNSKQRFSARIILLMIFAAAGVLAVSLYWTQIYKGADYIAKADKQYVKPTGAIFDRGSILFQSKDGTRPAAATVAGGYILYINPTLITDPAQAYQALAQYVTLDKADFIRKASQPNDPYEELIHRLPENTAFSIRALSIPGVNVVKESWRTYPGGELASHILGLVGQNKDTAAVEGRYGLERSYESVLSRRGIGPSVNVFAQLFSGMSDASSTIMHPGTIVTTIEPTVQAYLEKILSQTSDVWHSDEIGGIIIDPQTGEIAAMASLPTYDPNDISKIKDPAIFSNPLVEHVYEMGSIMKPLTMATGLDSGAITPSFTYDDTGTLTLSGKKISNYDGKARGVIGIQQILSQSLNVGAATVALKVGKDAFSMYFHNFGLGAKTGIDQPNEAAGIVTNLTSGRDIEIATAAYGQGLAVSPIAMARALAVLANGGHVVTPHLVKEIDYIDGTTQEIAVRDGAPVLSKETVDEVTRMLVTVVDTALRNGTIKMEHYSVAAKTGTAQIPDPATKTYYTDRYLHSFFGYFPAYDPKFLIFLYQKYPKGAQYASETLTEPFSDLTKFLINYYTIPPDR